MTSEQRYRNAILQAQASKARLKTSFRIAKERISPSRLKSDAYASMRRRAKNSSDQATAAMRAHPITTTAMIIGVTGFLFRRPIVALAQHLKRRFAAPSPPNPENFHEE